MTIFWWTCSDPKSKKNGSDSVERGEARGVEVVIEDEDKVLEISDDWSTTSVVKGKKSFAERVREL